MTNPNIDYFRNQRRALSTNIPEGENLILDVGCGAGHFGGYLKASGKAKQVYGIEVFSEAANEAISHLDRVKCADLDTLNLDELHQQWNKVKFDFIVFADVLEHTKDPWRLLDEFKAWLLPEGKVIISVPNIRHWKILSDLFVKGRFDYQDAGIMDRTHLRFFTKSTAHEMITNAGYSVSAVQPQIGGRWKTLSTASKGLFDEFLAIQFVFVSELTK